MFNVLHGHPAVLYSFVLTVLGCSSHHLVTRQTQFCVSGCIWGSVHRVVRWRAGAVCHRVCHHGRWVRKGTCL